MEETYTACRTRHTYLNDRKDDFVIQVNLGGFVENFTEVEEHPRVSVPALDETVAILTTRPENGALKGKTPNTTDRQRDRETDRQTDRDA